MDKAVILSACRTPIGSFGGVLKDLSAADLGAIVIREAIMGMGPVEAMKKAVAPAGLTLGDLDVIELNEAFAAQSIAVVRALGLDPKKVNVHGGAVALGHPIGASGARVLTTLIHALHARGGGRGAASLCIGGGMGTAMVIEVA
jgi:acetyl-CoA acetyltransferase